MDINKFTIFKSNNFCIYDYLYTDQSFIFYLVVIYYLDFRLAYILETISTNFFLVILYTTISLAIVPIIELSI